MDLPESGPGAPPATLMRSTGGPVEPVSSSISGHVGFVEGLVTEDRDRLTLAVDPALVQRLEVVGQLQVGPGEARIRGGRGMDRLRARVEADDAGDRPAHRRRQVHRTVRRVPSRTGSVPEVVEPGVEECAHVCGATGHPQLGALRIAAGDLDPRGLERAPRAPEVDAARAEARPEGTRPHESSVTRRGRVARRREEALEPGTVEPSRNPKSTRSRRSVRPSESGRSAWAPGAG